MEHLTTTTNIPAMEQTTVLPIIPMEHLGLVGQEKKMNQMVQEHQNIPLSQFWPNTRQMNRMVTVTQTLA